MIRKLVLGALGASLLVPVIPASAKCPAFSGRMAQTGMYYFDHHRYLLAATQLGSFVLDPECEEFRDYSRAETEYSLSLFFLGEDALAHDQVLRSHLSTRGLLLSLLWGESGALSANERARVEVWSKREDPADAEKKAQAAGSIPTPQIATLDQLAQQAQETSVNPVLASVYSGIIPGAGQAYAGAWQSAAISLVLNGILLGTTVEFANRGLAFPAALSGTLFSFTYVGGIIGAYQAAKIRDRAASEPYDRELFQDLFPELPGYDHFQRGLR